MPENRRPAWANLPENLEAARVAGWEDDDDDGPDPRDVIDRAAEENYRAHSSSVTGIVEGA